MSKIDSFEKHFSDELPSALCIQKTKVNQIKTESTKNFTIYEIVRKIAVEGDSVLEF